MSGLEKTIRQLISEELDKRQQSDIVPASEFCKKKGISRITLWRAERSGGIKITRIGKRCFVDQSQFRLAS